MNLVQVRLFGAFRDWRSNSTVDLELCDGATVADLRLRLSGKLSLDERGKALLPLVADSVFADDESTLVDSDSLVGRSRVAILPPVCGG